MSDTPGDSEMKSTTSSDAFIDLEHYRKLVRTYIDLVCILIMFYMRTGINILNILFFFKASLQNSIVLGRKGGDTQQIRSKRCLLGGAMHVSAERVPSGSAHNKTA